MASVTVRIKEESKAVMEELAREANEPMQEVLAKALELYRRQRIADSARGVENCHSICPSDQGPPPDPSGEDSGRSPVWV